MASKWVEALEDLGRRAKEWFADLEPFRPKPELVPVPVPVRRPRPEQGPRRR